MKKHLLYLFVVFCILFGVSTYSFAGDADDVMGGISDPNADAIQNNAQGSDVNDINGFCNTAAECAAIDQQVQQNQSQSTNILNQGNDITDQDLRNGNVDMETIPKVLLSLINVLLGVAGTVAIVAIIYYALQMQINSGITGDSSGVDKAKKGIRGAIIGFIIAIMAWFIVVRFIEILTNLSR